VSESAIPPLQIRQGMLIAIRSRNGSAARTNTQFRDCYVLAGENQPAENFG
jgi:hypothetical protein